MNKPHIIQLNSKDIHVNRKNYRHGNLDDENSAIYYFCTKKNLKTLELCKSIVTDGFSIDSVLMVTKDKQDRYIALDGNRRLTSIKILLDPTLIPSDTICNSLRNYVSKFQLGEIDDLVCFYYENEIDAAPSIRRLHTTGLSDDPWDIISQIRFDIDQGITPPFWYSLIDANKYDLFDQIDKPSTLDRVFKRERTMRFLPYSLDTYQFISPESLLHLVKIINDIATNDSLNSRTLNSSESIDNYLSNITGIPVHSPVGSGTSAGTGTSSGAGTSAGTSAGTGTSSGAGTSAGASAGTATPPVPIITDNFLLKNINPTHPKLDLNDKNKGIAIILNELKNLGTSSRNFPNYKKFKLSTFFLVRSLIEQSFKFWLKLYFPSNYARISNSRDPDMKVLIDTISTLINSNTIVFSNIIDPYFMSTMSNHIPRDHLNNMIHHPYLYAGDIESLHYYTCGSVYEILNFILTTEK